MKLLAIRNFDSQFPSPAIAKTLPDTPGDRGDFINFLAILNN
jgi:hypothetical protein